MEPFVISEATGTLHLDEWEKRFPSLVAGFTMRTGGSSRAPFSSMNLGLHVDDDSGDVVTNRKQMAHALGIPFDAWVSAEQVHGKNVRRVTAGGAGSASLDDVIPTTDGLHTDRSNIFLTTFYADCVPLFFIDPSNQAIGIAHAGWKGTIARIAEEMVRAFEADYGTRPQDLLAAIGPSIGDCCYEVDERIVEQVRSAATSWETTVTPQENGKYMLDLGLLNQLILRGSGLLSERITRTQYCTSCRTDLFFSHRREAGRTGRMASFIGWKEGATR